MSEFMKMVMPVIITLLLSGISTMVFNLYDRLDKIEERQIQGREHIVRIDHIKDKTDDQEERIRQLENVLLKHTSEKK